MDQVLNFLLFDKHEYIDGIVWSLILVSIFMLWVYATFSLFLKTFLTESILIFKHDLIIGRDIPEAHCQKILIKNLD